MENAIREGELRLLTFETPCDVVLSCQGRKLTAHKLILSVASPVLQDLFLQDSTDTTVLIFPEVEGSTMSLVLDYIYSGNVTISANNLQDFLGVATLLKLHLDYDCLENWTKSEKNHSLARTNQSVTQNFTKSNLEECDAIGQKKSPKKLPNLMPISSLQKSGVVARKGLYNRVFPSPWCPRVVPLLADPREDYSAANEKLICHHPTKDAEENDTNNNFQIRPQHRSFFPTTAFPEKKPKRHRPSSNVSRTPPSPDINSASSSPIHTENQQKLQLPEKSPVIYKHEKLNNDASEDAASDVDLKTESKEDSLKDVKSPGSSETTDEEVGVKKEHKVDKHKPFKCHDCGKSFSQLRNYKYHRSIHEGTREFAARCPECGKIFNDRGYLSSHLKIHRDRKEYACPNCPKRFNQRVAYNMHLRIHTGVKPHECPTCGKTFSRKMLLKQHQRVHTGERPYSCPECGKSFADRSNMSLHARLHTGVKPYACNLCPKSFTKKHHLKTHMNFHTGLKPYSCQKCGLSFSQSSNMRTHYKKCILKTPPTPTIS